MPKVLLASLLLLLARFTGAAEQAPAQEEPLPVFVLAGQSNMEGAGKIAELPPDLKGPFADVRFVRFWSTDFKPLAFAGTEKDFGPEVTFGVEMAKALKRPVGLIKLAVGGTSLEEHWNVESKDPRGLYRRLTGYVTGIQAKQKNIRIVGMIWMQGEADAKYHAKTVEQYRTKLEALIDGCRKEFNVPEMPFVCGRVNPPGAQYLKQVRDAQENLSRKNYAWFDCDDLEKHDDKLHYNTKGQLELGRRFAQAMLKLLHADEQKAGAAPGADPKKDAGK